MIGVYSSPKQYHLNNWVMSRGVHRGNSSIGWWLGLWVIVFAIAIAIAIAIDIDIENGMTRLWVRLICSRSKVFSAESLGVCSRCMGLGSVVVVSLFWFFPDTVCLLEDVEWLFSASVVSLEIVFKHLSESPPFDPNGLSKTNTSKMFPSATGVGVGVWVRIISSHRRRRFKPHSFGTTPTVSLSVAVCVFCIYRVSDLLAVSLVCREGQMR